MGMRPLAIGCAAVLLSGPAAARRGGRDRPREGNLKVGDEAPDFELNRLDGKGRVRLSTFKGRKPVVLVFGSYT